MPQTLSRLGSRPLPRCHPLTIHSAPSSRFTSTVSGMMGCCSHQLWRTQHARWFSVPVKLEVACSAHATNCLHAMELMHAVGPMHGISHVACAHAGRQPPTHPAAPYHARSAPGSWLPRTTPGRQRQRSGGHMELEEGDAQRCQLVWLQQRGKHACTHRAECSCHLVPAWLARPGAANPCGGRYETWSSLHPSLDM